MIFERDSQALPGLSVPHSCEICRCHTNLHLYNPGNETDIYKDYYIC